tara:strand:+ start:772 stop:1002 length:231 start_codon:yes stop_codon:yes gene_type:complete
LYPVSVITPVEDESGIEDLTQDIAMPGMIPMISYDENWAGSDLSRQVSAFRSLAVNRPRQKLASTETTENPRLNLP